MDQQRYPFAAQNLLPPRASAPGCTTRCPHTRPCPGARPGPAHPLFLPAARPCQAGGSKRCRRTRAPCGAGWPRATPAYTCASRHRRRAQTTCRIRPLRRSTAHPGNRENPCAESRRSFPRLTHTAAHSCSPGQSASHPDRTPAEQLRGRSRIHRRRRSSATARGKPAAIRSPIARSAEIAHPHTASRWLHNSSACSPCFSSMPTAARSISRWPRQSMSQDVRRSTFASVEAGRGGKGAR